MRSATRRRTGTSARSRSISEPQTILFLFWRQNEQYTKPHPDRQDLGLKIMILRHLALASGLAASVALAQDQATIQPDRLIMNEQPTPQVAPSMQSLPKLLADLPQGANVVIYRAHAEPTIWATTVKVDGTKMVALGNRQWTAVALDPGTYEIKTSWSIMSGQSGGKIILTVEPGKTHFLEIVGQSQYAGGGPGLMTFRMGSGIGEVMGNGAAARVANCCKFKEPKF